jgi:hypothetical protein
MENTKNEVKSEEKTKVEDVKPRMRTRMVWNQWEEEIVREEEVRRVVWNQWG